MAIRARGGLRSFVGRRLELAALEEFSTSEDTVAFVHGIAGIGKSALVSALAEKLEGDGAAVVVLDCRAIEPTERGLLRALGIEDVEDGLPTTLILDHYEVFRLMDTWLRQVLVPSLALGSHLVLAGRERPVAAWYSTRQGFRNLPLGPLDDADAVGMLDRFGVAEDEAERLNRIARGHPLALTLAAAGVAQQSDLDLEEAASGSVISELARLYLGDVEDPVTKRALEAASVVRRTTDSLLAAMLTDDTADDALQRLLDLPFVDAGRDGLVVHEAVREAIAAFLRATNPVRYRSYRRAAWRELRSEVGDAPPGDLWRYTADMLYLIENPVLREAFFPSGAQPLSVEPARPGDAAAIAAIAERHEPAEAFATLLSWWNEAPETFSVIRDRDAVVVGFFSLLNTTLIRRARSFADPVVDAWAQHLLDNPLPKGQVALALRRWLDSERGELPCAVQAACWLDVKRAYMALRPALRRMYVVVEDVPTYWPVVEKLGFRPIAEQPVELGGTAYSSVALDFGPGSVDGWLAELVGAELGVADEPVADESSRELSVRGELIALTPLEYGLFECLRQCEGKTVSRAELLREVWGTDFTGGSNVVDAVVRSLRRKLGQSAAIVETVRGSGYRLRSDWRASLR